MCVYSATLEVERLIFEYSFSMDLCFSKGSLEVKETTINKKIAYTGIVDEINPYSNFMAFFQMTFFFLIFFMVDLDPQGGLWSTIAGEKKNDS